jgi:rRNA maturation endonuclease Nob1
MRTDPPISGDLDEELCGWCGCALRIDWNMQPIVHDLCERKLAARTCAKCKVQFLEEDDGDVCRFCGGKLGVTA